MKEKSTLMIVLILILLQLASASFIAGNSSHIEKSYSPNDKVGGWINISLQNENSTSLISSNFFGSVKLIDFLNLNSVSYSCIPEDCKRDYISSNAEETKSFSLSAGEEKLLSFSLRDKIQTIKNLSFDMNINNQPSCTNPVEIDLLDDNITDSRAGKFGESFDCRYGNERGCFNSNEDLEYVYIGGIPFCEKINLTKSGKFALGAWVKGDDSGFSDKYLEMGLYDLNENKLASCNLPQPSLDGGDIYCKINYTNNEIKEYYVCIKANSTSPLTNYVTQKENANPCGFYAYPGEQQDYYDYNIFAKGARYENIGLISFNDTEYYKYRSLSLNDDLLNYISERFNKNCTNECKIPLRIKAYSSVNMVISNAKVEYSTAGGFKQPEKNIYDTEEKPAKISSGFVKLDLKYSNISLSSLYGNYTFRLFLDNKQVIFSNITILRTPEIKFLSPQIAGAATTTKFVVGVSSPDNKTIVKYRWDFGDNTSEESDVNFVNHAYNSIGSYNLVVEAEDSSGLKAKKSFVISVGSPKENANSTILEYKTRLSNISLGTLSFTWYKTLIEDEIRLKNLNDELNELEKSYKSATSDAAYVSIMANLTRMNVPKKIKEETTGEIPYFASPENIELSYLKELGAGDYSNEGKYKEAVARWQEENLNVSINFKYIAIYYDNEKKLLGVYKLKINPKEDIDKIYLVINNDVKFEHNASVVSLSDASGIVLQGNSQDISFIATEEVEKIKISLSPDFSQLEISKEIEPCNFNNICEKELDESSENCPSDCKPWNKIVLWWIIIGIVGLIAGIILVWWYKTRYESHLFKNKNDLFNITNFIRNSRKQGMKDSETISKLKDMKWSSEQISYAFKKAKA